METKSTFEFVRENLMKAAHTASVQAASGYQELADIGLNNVLQALRGLEVLGRIERPVRVGEARCTYDVKGPGSRCEGHAGHDGNCWQ